MRIGLIADQFTHVALALEPNIDIVALSPQLWRIQLIFKPVDILLIESCWQGNDGQWRNMIASYSNHSKCKTIKQLTSYCRQKKIPTVFWNKEDPIHYDRFKHNIEYFDVCLTTEKELVKHYKQTFPHLKMVANQAFFFQPRIHNPEIGKRLEVLSRKIIFCGGLYKNEFPLRAQQLEMAATTLGSKLVVFDRFEHSDNSWELSKNIARKTGFKYIDSKSYYQSGLAHLNVNTCDGSETMISRRLIELLACGTNVIELTNFKGKHFLSQYVHQVSSADELESAYLKLSDDQTTIIEYQELVEHYSVSCFIRFLNKLT
ncbi:CgeB family protein [Shewanella violacea]|uniref:DUF3880 domain-containing protein n=1 Tax=Shewanella violacea (strain JCM 10179 / CIP 106290 / LMG 19151 / DSS12) TaxID=637905 RepID=D4ZFY9_SHEVD|nr:hypothetical protein [Shewanella violacea]BAJ00588.1 conserved hypothetical protein [Shewanella violacea DSS12]